MLRLFRPAPDPDRIEVAHGGIVYPVTIRRHPAARRLTLRVGRSQGITLTMPSHASLAAARRFAAAQGGWIAARLARLPATVPFGPGAAIPFRGVTHAIVHDPTGRRGVAVAPGSDGPCLTVGGDAAGVPGRVRRFLAAEAKGDLARAVAVHAAALGVAAGRVAIRDTRSRWGSCSSSGALSFSWRLILAPPLVLDYLAAHEVAHLRELNHSQRFWRLVHDLCPATDEAERWLRRNGADLHRYG